MSDFCESFSCLPYPGGLRQQPVGLMRRMLLYRAYKSACEAYDAPWRENNPDAPPLPQSVQRLLFLGQDMRVLLARNWTLHRPDGG